MKTPALVAALLVALGLAGWLVLRDAPREPVPAAGTAARPAEPAREPASLVPADLPDASAAPRAPAASEPSAAAPSRAPAASEAAETPVLTGRVLARETGAGVPGLTLTVELTELGPERGSETVRTETGDLGLFRVDLPGPATVSHVRVDAGRATAAAEERPDLRVSAGEEELVLHVTRGAAVRGRVVDLGGRPVAGADVFGWCRSRYAVEADPDLPPDRTARTDANGAFGLVALGPSFVVSARTAELLPVRRAYGELLAGRDADGVELVLGPTARLAGRVVDESGRAVEGVRVEAELASLAFDGPVTKVNADAATGVLSETAAEAEGGTMTSIEGVLRAGARPVTTTSGADGGFELVVPVRVLDRSIAHDVYDVTATRVGYPVWKGEAAADEGELVIRLQRGAVVSGLVLDPDGAPVAGAEVSVTGFHARGATRTDAEGGFELDGLEEEEDARLYVHAAGYAIQVVQPVPVRDGGSDPVTVRLEPGLALAGRVLDEAGAPVFDALVALQGDRRVDLGDTVTSPPSTWEWVLRVDRAHTDERGAFRFEDLYAGEFDVRVSPADGSGLSMSVRAPSGTEDLEIRLDREAMRAVVLTGTVVDALTGEPLSTFTVWPMLPVDEGDGGGMFGQAREFHAADGRFEIAGLPPGPIGVGAEAPGYSRWSLDTAEYAVGEHVLDVRLVPSRSATLRFVTPSGEPLTRARIMVRRPSGEQLVMPWNESTSSTSIFLPATGEVDLQGLPAEHLTVSVRLFSAPEEQEFDLDLTSPPTAPIEIAVE